MLTWQMFYSEVQHKLRNGLLAARLPILYKQSTSVDKRRQEANFGTELMLAL